MGFKKKSKVSAEFSMSSLTDIIFLLLIFFMLTSSLVTPNALNLKLPGKKSTNTSTSPSTIKSVSISKKGTYFLDGSRIEYAELKNRYKRIPNEYIAIEFQPNSYL